VHTNVSRFTLFYDKTTEEHRNMEFKDGSEVEKVGRRMVRETVGDESDPATGSWKVVRSLPCMWVTWGSNPTIKGFTSRRGRSLGLSCFAS